jgi:tetratricopeptide (TPR) repeat protein
MSSDEFAVESYIRGMARQLRGDHDQAIRLFTMATDQDPGFMIGWYELAIAERQQGNYQRALAILDSLEPAPLEMRVRINNARGIAYWRQGLFEEASVQYQQALELARAQQESATIRLVLTNVGLVSMAMDDLPAARSALNEALSLTDPITDSRAMGSISNSLARLEHQSGDLEAAIVHVENAIEAFARAGNLRYEASARSRLSGYLIERGQLIDARRLSEEALAVRRQLNDQSGQISSLGKLARIAMIDGHLGKAETLWREVLSLHARAEHREESGLIHANLADMHLLAGHQEQARTQIGLLGAEAARADSERLDRAHHRMLLRLDLAEGQLEQAEQRLGMLDQTDVDDQVLTARLRALQGQPEVAIETYQNAIRDVDETRNRRRQIRFRLALAELYLDQDRLADARATLEPVFGLNPHAYPALRVRARLMAAAGQRMQASVLMNELKRSANEWWTADDQQQLESYQRDAPEPTSG